MRQTQPHSFFAYLSSSPSSFFSSEDLKTHPQNKGDGEILVNSPLKDNKWQVNLQKFKKDFAGQIPTRGDCQK